MNGEKNNHSAAALLTSWCICSSQTKVLTEASPQRFLQRNQSEMHGDRLKPLQRHAVGWSYTGTNFGAPLEDSCMHSVG